MSRIHCKTPSTGRPVNLTVTNLGTGWITLAEAPDFSVPDASNIFAARDPLDGNRAIRAGEIFFMTPIYARNKSGTDCWIEVRLMQENGAIVECPGRMLVPGGDTALVPVQGRSLIKRGATNTSGDRLQVRAQTASALDLWATAEEKPSAEHIGVV
jgi:hypothetical protein